MSKTTTNTPPLKRYRRSDLEQFTVAQLRKLVRQHNLHSTYIRKYYIMKKADIITAFLKHHNPSAGHDVEVQDSATYSPPVTPVKTSEPMKRTQKAPKASKRKPKGKKSYAAKPKMTALDKAVGINKPLYTKGVSAGAKEQFERRYGPIVPSKAKRDMSQVSTTNIVPGRRKRKPKTPGKEFV